MVTIWLISFLYKRNAKPHFNNVIKTHSWKENIPLVILKEQTKFPIFSTLRSLKSITFLLIFFPNNFTSKNPCCFEIQILINSLNKYYYTLKWNGTFCVRGMLSLFLVLCFTKDPIIISTTGTDKVRLKPTRSKCG